MSLEDSGLPFSYEPFSDPSRENDGRRTLLIAHGRQTLDPQDWADTEVVFMDFAMPEQISFLASLPRLHTLYLLDPSLSGRRWEELLQKLSLRKLWVAGPYILPSFFHCCGQLESLSLVNCEKVTDEDVQILAESDTLKHLLLESPYTTQEGLKCLGHIPHLELDRCDVDDDVVASFTGVEQLVINGGTLSDMGIGHLASLPKLRALHAGVDNEWTDLGPLKHLEELSLSGRELTNNVVQSLGQFTDLRKLRLENGHFSDRGISALGKLENLELLQLDSGHLRQLPCLAGLPKLSSVTLPRMDDAIMAELDATTHLEHLKTRHSSELTSRGLGHLLSQKNLSYLDCQYCEGIDDECLAIISEINSLRYLNLRGCKAITPKGVAALGSLPNLQLLSLAECPLVTDEAVSIISDLENLAWLSLYRCSLVGDEGIKTLMKRPGLRHLDFHWTKVSVPMRQELHRSLPFAHIVP